MKSTEMYEQIITKDIELHNKLLEGNGYLILDKNNIISVAFENIKFIVLTEDYDKNTFNFTAYGTSKVVLEKTIRMMLYIIIGFQQ